MFSVLDSQLGQHTTYPTRYDPTLLFTIPRSQNRAQWASTLPLHGVDIWTGYEVSWLNARGLPQVRIAEFSIPAASPNLIESKSFKLYLNSINAHVFETETQVLETLEQDLSVMVGAEVNVRFYSVDQGLPLGQLSGECLDSLPITITHYTPTPHLIQRSGIQGQSTWYSHLLKSNCPVTGQPDWGSVSIEVRGRLPTPESLLAMIVSYREHQDFHEHCVESLFTELWQALEPEYLCVFARYVRRGGLDINPWRCSDINEVSTWTTMPRLARQ